MSALCEIGEIERARALCEKLLAYASDLGLYAEEIDTRSGRHLGNFPQAFTHLALINAVMHVIKAEAMLEAEFTDFSRDPATIVSSRSSRPRRSGGLTSRRRLALGLGALPRRAGASPRRRR